MKKIKKNYPVRDLSREISLIQIEKFADSFNNAMKKEHKNETGRALLLTAPLVISTIAYAITLNVFLVVYGAAMTGIMVTITSIKDSIEEFKKSKSEYNKINVIKLNEEKEDVDKILEDGIGEVERYYTDKYKKILSEQENKQTPTLTLIEHYNKDETMAQIVREIDKYRWAYKLPMFEISNDDWEFFFDKVYSVFLDKGIEDSFYDTMSQVTRYTLASILVNNRKRVYIKDFIESLYYISNDLIPQKELLELQKELLVNVKQSEVIDITKCKRIKR